MLKNRNKIYEKGLLKVVWIKNDEIKIYSKMFDEITQALEFAQSKDDFLVFKLLKQKDLEDFSWELLPHGKHKLYKFLFRSYKKINNQGLRALGYLTKARIVCSLLPFIRGLIAHGFREV